MNEGQLELLIDREARRSGGVLRVSDVRESLASVGRPVESNTLSKAFGAMVERGDGIRVAKGIFALRNARGELNPVAIAPRIALGRAYVSMWTVAARAGLTYNEPRLVSVVTEIQARPTILELPDLDVAVYFHRISPRRFFGFTEQPTGDGLTAPIASVEKALIDMLWFADAPDTPPVEELFEIWKAASESPAVNPRLLLKYAIDMGSPTIARRVGYLMERFGLAGSEELVDHRGSGHRTVPLLTSQTPYAAPSNRWGVR